LDYVRRKSAQKAGLIPIRVFSLIIRLEPLPSLSTNGAKLSLPAQIRGRDMFQGMPAVMVGPRRYSVLSELQPVVLRGTQIYLEPLEMRHTDELFVVGKDPAIWRFQPKGPFTTQDDAKRFVERALSSRDFGGELPFIVRLSDNDELIGTTRYRNIQPRHCSVEIGFTFIHPSHWWRGAGTEAVYLLGKHAFENLEAGRVWFMTDVRNYWTQKALERCGITREGVLRRHLRGSDGFIRDSVIYATISEEWPAVKQRVQALFARSQNRGEADKLSTS
jgi:RimJ/RimL family protein N-acetyltransferase